MTLENVHLRHCDSCIKIKKCIKSKACPVVPCKVSCGHWMHECKSREHEDMCPNVRISCINSQNGCPHRLLRKDLKMHLMECPASVVRCNAQWCRWKLDQPQAGRKAINLDITQELAEGLVISDEDLVSKRKSGHHCNLDLGLEYLPFSYKNKPAGLETFECGQLFRRDHYSTHYKVVHSDIFGCLGGFWLDARCPLFSYGCTFSVRRLKPCLTSTDTKDFQVLFSGLLRAFGVYSETTNNTQTRSSSLNLSDMPVEVMEKIFGYLDGFSLNNLALTSKQMRDVSRFLLPIKGIVVLKWKLGDNGKWFSEEEWLFPNSFDDVCSWSLLPMTQLFDHMKNCPFNDRVVHTKPFNICPSEYPDKGFQESKKCV